MLLSEQTLKKKFLDIPLNIWSVGFVTLFKNISSVVLVVYCPVYLSQILGLNLSSLGLLEGLLESFSFFSRIFSGVLSDSFRRRKPFLLIGYLLSLCGRFLLTFSTTVGGIFTARTCERLGNGIQATPRDALVGDFASKTNRAASFGLRYSLTIFGSIVGAFGSMWIMFITQNNYTFLFCMTLIPSILATLCLIFFVRDSSNLMKSKRTPITFGTFYKDIKNLPFQYWRIILVSFVCMLSNFGIAFLTLRAIHCGLPSYQAPFVMIIQSIATCLIAFPSGRMADRFGPKLMIGIGILALVCANLLMSSSGSLFWIFTGIALWGIQMGFVQNNLLALISFATPEHLRGTGFGIMQFMNGIGTLLANTMMGHVGQYYSPSIAFQVSVVIGVVALILLMAVVPSQRTLSRTLKL
jgi:MFS family permease